MMTKVLSQHQFGFRSGLSTFDGLFCYMYIDMVLLAVDGGYKACGLIVDLLKVIDLLSEFNDHFTSASSVN